MVRWAALLVHHRAFGGLVVAAILLAGVLAGMETSPELLARHAGWFTWLDRLVMAVFTAEIGLRLLACAPRPLAYFRDGWNVFDFIVLVLCYLPASGPFAAVLRLARLLRLVRLIHALPRLQLLVGALLRSLSGLGYVTLLLLLLFYVYAVAGVHLFRVADPVDFGSLPAALLTLFRVVTLDNWGDIFTRVLAGAPGVVTTLYFVTFIVLGTMIFLNLFIGIIMNSMAETHRELEGAAPRAGGGPAAALRDLAEIEAQSVALQARLRDLRLRLAEGSGPPADAGPSPARPPAWISSTPSAPTCFPPPSCSSASGCSPPSPAATSSFPSRSTSG